MEKSGTKTDRSPHISVITPVYNEEGNLPGLIRETESALEDYDYEIIFVDDGSSDGSFDILMESRERNRRVKIIRFNGNFGQHSAMMAGFQAANGDILVTLDADLQNNPQDIPRFIEKIEKGGCAAAFGWRVNRENRFFLRQLPSKFFNWVRNRYLEHPLHDYGCALNAFRREFVDELAGSPGYLRHITTYIAGKKVPCVEIRINERERQTGSSNYNFMILLQLAIDILITTSTKPVATSLLVLTAAVSFALFMFSALFSVYSLLAVKGSGAIELFLFPFVFFVSSLVCGVLALINEKVSNLLRQMNKKPPYIIKEQLD